MKTRFRWLTKGWVTHRLAENSLPSPTRKGTQCRCPPHASSATPAELEALADRWACVEGLERGLPYREVHRATGVSVTTVGRVARYLADGNGGYLLAARRLDSQRHEGSSGRAATSPR